MYSRGRLQKVCVVAKGISTGPVHLYRIDVLLSVHMGRFTACDGIVLIQMGFSYQLGGKMYDYTYASMMHAGRASELGGAWHKDILKAWTPENPNTNVPRLNTSDTDANQMSDRFLVSSNYLSINNIMLGYNLPTNLVKKIGLSGVRVYGAADNVALFCARKGADPRQGRYSTDGSGVYTPIRSVTFGVKVSF